MGTRDEGMRVRMAVLAAVILIAECVKMQGNSGETSSSVTFSLDVKGKDFPNPDMKSLPRSTHPVRHGLLKSDKREVSLHDGAGNRQVEELAGRTRIRTAGTGKTMKTSATIHPFPTLSSDTSGIPDVTGSYDGNRARECKCWNQQSCDCVKDGCKYVERVEISTADELGIADLSLSATDDTCWKGQRGPMRVSLDRCASVMGGARWTGSGSELNVSYFRPDLLHQELDVVVFGNILGYDDQPPVFRQTAIMRENVTVCSNEERVSGQCKSAEEKLVCVEKFASCSSGNCYGKGRKGLSPKDDGFLSQFTTGGLSGRFELLEERSSPACPSNISVFHFGTWLGLGWSKEDMVMTRLTDRSLVTDAADCVQFFSSCNGLQWSFDLGFQGKFTREDERLVLHLFLLQPMLSGRSLNVDKCVMKTTEKAPQLVDDSGDQHSAILSVTLLFLLSLFANAGLLACCWSYRKRYFETKIARHYDIFQG